MFQIISMTNGFVAAQPRRLLSAILAILFETKIVLEHLVCSVTPRFYTMQSPAKRRQTEC